MTSTSLYLGVLKESAPGERRVALVPEGVSRLRAGGLDVLVERGAGEQARYPDEAYAEAGAVIVDAADVDSRADLLLCVQPPQLRRVAGLHAGQVLLGLLAPAANPELIDTCTRLGVTAVSLDLLPRTLSRAQSMDALTSQAGFAGYKAALLAAAAYERFLPLMMTAAGTAPPAQVLVLGTGVAGLSALGTARRLGAVVTGYDIRPETADEVRSVGARFLRLGDAADGSGTGGYARALSPSEREAQQAALQERIGGFDIVITTAQVPGRRPPVLVTRDALKAMRPGSVVVDLAAGPLGGNVEGSEPDRTIVVEDGVTVIGAGSLPASMAAGASAAYARNIAAMVNLLVGSGAVLIDPGDEILRAAVVTRPGRRADPATATATQGPETVSGTAVETHPEGAAR
jgi:NAD(P) transhydrogenase subunit alpha